MQEIWVPSLAWEDPLKKRMATHSNLKKKKKKATTKNTSCILGGQKQKLPAVLLKFWFLGGSNNDTTGAAGWRWWTGGWPGLEWSLVQAEVSEGLTEREEAPV